PIWKVRCPVAIGGKAIAHTMRADAAQPHGVVVELRKVPLEDVRVDPEDRVPEAAVRARTERCRQREAITADRLATREGSSEAGHNGRIDRLAVRRLEPHPHGGDVCTRITVASVSGSVS